MPADRFRVPPRNSCPLAGTHTGRRLGGTQGTEVRLVVPGCPVRLDRAVGHPLSPADDQCNAVGPARVEPRLQRPPVILGDEVRHQHRGSGLLAAGPDQARASRRMGAPSSRCPAPLIRGRARTSAGRLQMYAPPRQEYGKLSYASVGATRRRRTHQRCARPGEAGASTKPPVSDNLIQAPLAQSAERLHGKEKVYGSIP